MRRLFITTLIGIILLAPLLTFVLPASAQSGTCTNLYTTDSNFTLVHGVVLDANSVGGEYVSGAYGPLSAGPKWVIDGYWYFSTPINVSYWSNWGGADSGGNSPNAWGYGIKYGTTTSTAIADSSSDATSNGINGIGEPVTTPYYVQQVNSGLTVSGVYVIRAWGVFFEDGSHPPINFRNGAIEVCYGATPGPTVTPSPTMTPTPGPTPIAPPPSSACTSNWTTTFDFSTGVSGWLANPGSSVTQDSSGYHAAPEENADSTFSKKITISRALQVGYIGSISLDVTYVAGTGGSPDLRSITVKGPVGNTLINDSTPPVSGRKTLTWAGTATPGTYTIEAVASGGLASIWDVDGDATINRITLSGAGLDPDGQCHAMNPNPDSSDWAYPVSSADQIGSNSMQSLASDSTSGAPEGPYQYLEQGISAGTYDHSKAATLVLATGEGKYVHSAFDGTVDGVTPLNISDPCITFDISLLGGLTSIPSYTCIFSSGGAVQALDYHTASVVTVTTGSTTLSYVVNDARVTAGQSVSKGCILGLTLPLFTLKPSLGIGSATGLWEKSPDGYTIVQGRASSLPFDVVPQFVEQPADLECGTSGGGVGSSGQGCSLVKNASFAPANDVWYSNEIPVSPLGASQGLWLKSATTQQLLLDPAATYTIDVVAHLLMPPDPGVTYDFSLQLGSGTAITVAVTDALPNTYQITGTTYAATSGNIYDLVLTPTSNTREMVAVDFVCVNDGVAPPTELSDCILGNPYFNDASAWQHTGTVAFEPGIATLDDGATISQTLMLAPKDSGDQEYKLEVHFRKKGTFVGGEYAAIDWAIASATGSSDHSTDQLGSTILSDTFTITTKDDYTLTLQANNSHSTVQVQITSVCLATSDGVPTPGYVSRPPITANCRVCSYSPLGDVNVDLGEAIGWLFCSIAQIWHCQAKTILMGIWTQIVNILTFIGFARLWLAYTMDSAIKWVGADLQVFARWLNGEFLNLAARFMPSNSGSGTNLWDALIAFFNTLASVLNRLLDTIVGLAMALLSIVGLIITIIGNILMLLVRFFLDLMQTILSLITSMLNAPATLPPGTPICDTSASMIPESCVPIFMLDHTLFDAASPIAFLIPLIEGLAGFGLLFWAWGKFRSAIIGTE